MNRSFGPYFADPGSDSGQYRDRQAPDVIYNYNSPDPSQPGLWCQWEANEPGTEIHWDGGEKFYYSEEWMAYIINHFLRPGAVASRDLPAAIRADARFAHFTFDHVVNGEILAEGEEQGDVWKIVVVDNELATKSARLVWED